MTQRRALVDIDGKLQETPTGDTLYGAGDISGAVALAPDSSSRNVIQPTGAAIIPLIAKGYAAQSADIQQWQISDGTVVARINGHAEFDFTRGSGTHNFGAGRNALALLTSGDYVVAIGNDALYSATTGYYNVGVGASALYYTLGGGKNVAIGWEASLKNTSGNNNTAIGTQALNQNQTGAGNVALGHMAGYYETGSNAFYVNNQDRTNTAGDKANSLLYGVFNASSASQTLAVNAALTVGYGETINTGAAGTIGLVVKGASAQTAYLQQWQNSAGSALASIDASGKINATAGTITAPGGGSSAFNVVSVAGHGGPLFTVEPLTGGYFTVQVDGKVGAGVYINPAARIHSKATAAAEIASIFQGTTSQTANLTEWQDSSGTVVGSISADGQTVAFGNASSGTTTITTKATDPGMSMLIQPATNSASGASGDLNLKSAASSYASYGPGNINIIVPDVPFTGSRTNGEIYLKGCDNTTAGPTGGATPGGRIRLLAGYGMIGTTNTGGTGGEISITTGAGGVCTKAGSAAGAGGALSLAGGAGGVQSASTGGTGGAGGSLALTAGVGGAQTGSSGTRTGGAGGNIVLTAGAGGTGATANGADGKVIVRAFSGQTSNLQEWQNSSAAIKASVAADGSVATASDAYFYLGDSATNGSWRIGRSGNDLVFERRESGSWVTKSTVTP